MYTMSMSFFQKYFVICHINIQIWYKIINLERLLSTCDTNTISRLVVLAWLNVLFYNKYITHVLRSGMIVVFYYYFDKGGHDKRRYIIYIYICSIVYIILKSIDIMEKEKNLSGTVRKVFSTLSVFWYLRYGPEQSLFMEYKLFAYTFFRWGATHTCAP